MAKPKPINRIFPFLMWLPLLNRSSVRADFIAGITGAVIVLPQGVAFAMIAGLPPEYGLYTAMITPIIAALFGSSFHLISGPTTAISIVVFSALGNYATPGSPEFIQLALVLAFLAGAFQLGFGLARMGSLVNFVSHTVIIGFTAGASILIVTSQLKHLLGVDLPRRDSFLHTLGDMIGQLGEINYWVLGIGIGTLLVALGIRKWLPKWPYMLIAMVVGSLLSILLNAESHGVKLVGEIPGHLPPFSLPDLSASNIRLLAPDAFAIALLGLIEAVSISKAIATKTQQRIDGNQEFIGQGLSNLIGSFFSCYPGSGSFTRSGLNHQTGAKTPLAAIFAAIILALILLLVAPYTAYLPMPAMGGIILLVGYNLIDFHHIRTILKASKGETAIFLVTFGATLFLDLEFAIYLGVLLSLVFYLRRTSRPNVVTLAPDPEAPKRKFVNIVRVPVPECPQLKTVRIDGSLYFGSIDHISGYLKDLSDQHPEQKHLLILASGINFLDLAGAELLLHEIQRWQENGGDAYVCGLLPPARSFLKKVGIWDKIGENHLFWTKNDAIRDIYPLLNREICASCKLRIYKECQTVSVPELSQVETHNTQRNQ